MISVVVVGQGYVGLPMALRAAEAGHKVTGLDLNEAMVANLNKGVSHIDDVSDADLARGLEQGFTATTDAACIADADVVDAVADRVLSRLEHCSRPVLVGKALPEVDRADPRGQRRHLREDRHRVGLEPFDRHVRRG